MDFVNILKTHAINTFNDVSQLLTSMGLVVKDYKSNPSLYMIYYKHGVNSDKPEFKQFRGLIVEKETNKIICYTLDRMMHVDNIEKIDVSFTDNDIHQSESLEGTQLKLYYYGDKWNVATTRCIDIKFSKWGKNNKTFADLFNDVAHMIDYDKLDKSCCYSLLMQHSDNQMVFNHNNKKLFHIMTRSLTIPFLEVYNDNIGLERPNCELLEYSKTCKRAVDGTVVLDRTNNIRYKIIFPEYAKMRDLKGNQFDMLYRYIELWKDDKLTEFLMSFGGYAEMFKEYKEKISLLSKFIHDTYINVCIRKTGEYVDKPFYKYIKILHKEYLVERTPRTKQLVLAFIKRLHASQIYFMCNAAGRVLPPCRGRTILNDA
jgi:hypothetical protein